MTPIADARPAARQVLALRPQRSTIGAQSPGAIWGTTNASDVPLSALTEVISPRVPANLAVAERYIAHGGGVAVAGRDPKRNSLMISADGRIGVAIDGRVDNVSDLRRLVGGASVPDSELLAAVYRRFGPSFIERLDGEFAVALWHASERILVLARDHAGTRPLYFTTCRGSIVFASDIESLVAMLGARPSFRVPSLVSYLSFLYASPPHTMFEGVSQVGPGEWMSFGPHGEIATARYGARHGLRAGREAGVEIEVRSRFGAAIERSLAGDEQPVFLLSGGVDSATIVAHAARRAPGLRTATLGFSDWAADDERRDAGALARTFGVQNEQLEVGHECLDVLGSATRALGAPVGNPAALLAWEIANRLSGSNRAIVCGDGGNEVFGGTPKYFQLMSMLVGRRAQTSWRVFHGVAQHVWHRLRACGADPLFHRAAHLYFRVIGSLSGPRSWAMSPEQFEQALRFYVALESIWSEDRIRSLLTSDVRDMASRESAQSLFRAALSHPESTDLVSQLIRLRLDTIVANNALPYVERTAAANGVDARFPYLERRLATYLTDLPVELNYGRGYRYLMRRALGGPVPAEVYTRVRGFNAPLASWLRTPRWRELTGDLLSHETVRSRGWFNPKIVGQMLKQFYAGDASLSTERLDRRQPLALSIWSLVALEAFCQHYGR